MQQAATITQALITAPARTRRTRLAVYAVVLLVTVSVIGATVLSDGAAAATHAAAEKSLVAKVNKERRTRGLGRLIIDVQLTRVARAWADTMAARDVLGHNPRLAVQVKGDWRRVGENVGYSTKSGASEATLLSRLHDAFMASPGHRANVLRDYNQIGVGVTVTPKGKMWVTVVFASASLSPARKEVTTSVRASRHAFAAADAAGHTAQHVVLQPATADAVVLPPASGDGGPTLFTPGPSAVDPAPVLHPAVRAEIDRVLGGRGTVYLAPDRHGVSKRAARELVQDGYTVRRLGSAAAVAPAEQVSAP